MTLIETFQRLKGHASRYSHVNWALADQAMVSGANFFTGILIARAVGFEEYGRFVLAWTLVLFCGGLNQAGIISPMMTFGTRQSPEDEPHYYGGLILQQVIWSLFCFVVVLVGFRLYSWWVPGFEIATLGMPLACAVATWQAQDFVRRYFFARNAGRIAFLVDGICYIGQVCLLGMAFVWWDLNAERVLLLVAGTAATASVAGVLQMNRYVLSFKALHSVTRMHWSTSKWLTASALVQWTSGNFFILVLGASVGAGAVGALRAAQNIMGVTHVLFLGLENIVPAGASRSLKERGLGGLRSYLCRVALVCTGLTLLFCVAVTLASEQFFVLLYGKEYSGYSYLLLWFVPIYLLTSLGLPQRAALRALGSVRPLFVAHASVSVFSLAVAEHIVRSYELTGAMAGLLVSQLVIQGYMFTVLRKLLRNHKLEHIR